MIDSIKEALCEIMEPFKEKIDECIESIQEVFDKFTEKIDLIDYEEWEKYELCYKSLFPIFNVFSHRKLWQQNRALFRPYKMAAFIAIKFKGV